MGKKVADGGGFDVARRVEPEDPHAAYFWYARRRRNLSTQPVSADFCGVVTAGDDAGADTWLRRYSKDFETSLWTPPWDMKRFDVQDGAVTKLAVASRGSFFVRRVERACS